MNPKQRQIEERIKDYKPWAIKGWMKGKPKYDSSQNISMVASARDPQYDGDVVKIFVEGEAKPHIISVDKVIEFAAAALLEEVESLRFWEAVAYINEAEAERDVGDTDSAVRFYWLAFNGIGKERMSEVFNASNLDDVEKFLDELFPEDAPHEFYTEEYDA